MSGLCSYRGRIAPSPTGFLHLGHARTFWIAHQKAQARGGTLILRNEDLDRSRCKTEFVTAMIEDLRWFGLDWQEGPDRGGRFGPYTQSERMDFYRAAFEKLKAAGRLYPCACSRQDVLRALTAPHAGQDEPLYPGTCRPKPQASPLFTAQKYPERRGNVNWRCQVQDGQTINFDDLRYGPQQFVAGRDFGDFVVWRHDDFPSYQLAVVVDDAAMQITEVVRGEDLLKSTARQILLYSALGIKSPAFYHCPLMTDDSGARLAKRHDSLSLRKLRAAAASPEALRARPDWGKIQF